MRLRDALVRQLMSNSHFGALEWGMYLAIWHSMPESLTGLAAHAKVSREVAKRVCGLLAQHGWLEHRADGYRIRPVAVIPESCQVYLAELVEMEYGLVEKKGELLMKRLLDLMIASDAYVVMPAPGS